MLKNIDAVIKAMYCFSIAFLHPGVCDELTSVRSQMTLSCSGRVTWLKIDRCFWRQCKMKHCHHSLHVNCDFKMHCFWKHIDYHLDEILSLLHSTHHVMTPGLSIVHVATIFICPKIVTRKLFSCSSTQGRCQQVHTFHSQLYRISHCQFETNKLKNNINKKLTILTILIHRQVLDLGSQQTLHLCLTEAQTCNLCLCPSNISSYTGLLDANWAFMS